MFSGEGNNFENVVLSCLGQLACPHVMGGGHVLVPRSLQSSTPEETNESK